MTFHIDLEVDVLYAENYEILWKGFNQIIKIKHIYIDSATNITQ